VLPQCSHFCVTAPVKSRGAEQDAQLKVLVIQLSDNGHYRCVRNTKKAGRDDPASVSVFSAG